MAIFKIIKNGILDLFDPEIYHDQDIPSKTPIMGKRKDLRELYNSFDDLYKKGNDDYITGGDFSLPTIFSPPFVTIKLNDSTFIKRLTMLDNRTLPAGSLVRQLYRTGKFLASTPGVLFLAKQFMLQLHNPISDTRTYNPLSILGSIVPGVNIPRMMLFGYDYKTWVENKQEKFKGESEERVSTPGFGGSNNSTNIIQNLFNINKKNVSILELFINNNNLPHPRSYMDREDLSLYGKFNKYTVGTLEIEQNIYSDADKKTYQEQVIDDGDKTQTNKYGTQYNTKTKQDKINKRYNSNNINGTYYHAIQNAITNEQKNKEFNYNTLDYNPSTEDIGNKDRQENKLTKRKGLVYRPTLDYTNNLDSINMLEYGKDYSNGVKDFIPFKIYDIYNKKYIIFRAFLNSSINDVVGVNWSSDGYMGRPSPLFTYEETDRILDLDFKVVAFNPKELKPLWVKLNYLRGLAYPHFTMNNRMISPFIKLTIGDILKDTPGLLKNINITFDDNYSWDLGPIMIDDNKSGGAILPMGANITLTFQVIGDRLPTSTSKHYFGLPDNWDPDNNNWKREI